MIEDPHKVLGVAPGATQEEIKKAYRQMAKKYHPDLHPNDPSAHERMNEINEAYDMLMNPEKYASKRAQQQQSQARQQGYYGQQSQGGSRNSRQGYNPYQGPGGWASDDFNFEDIFGFGFGDTQQASTQPEYRSDDSMEIRRVVNAINSGRYQEAISILTHIPSTGRNARWYYLSALANHGLGNSVQAIDHMQRAAQMEPNNRTYVQLLQQFRRAGQTYETNAQGFNMHAMELHKICLGLFAAQFLCGPFSCLRCI